MALLPWLVLLPPDRLRMSGRQRMPGRLMMPDRQVICRSWALHRAEVMGWKHRRKHRPEPCRLEA